VPTEKQRAEKVHKRDRVPVGGQRQKTQLSEVDLDKFAEDGFVVRWFTDAAGRVQAAVAGGWDFVKPEEAMSIGQHSLHAENSDLGSKVSIVADREGTRQVLMKIEKEYFDEDQAAKEERNALVDQALRPTDQGGATIQGGYTPT